MKFFKKKIDKKAEKSGCSNASSACNSCLSSVWDYLHQNGMEYASMSMAYNLYETTAALSDAVDTICNHIKSIKPCIFDED